MDMLARVKYSRQTAGQSDSTRNCNVNWSKFADCAKTAGTPIQRHM